MKILSRYIGRTVIIASVLAMAVMLSIYTFLSFVDELRDVGKGSYDLRAVTEFVLWTLPGRIYDLFPACALLGTLLGLGWLASTSELIAMRAAGLSIASITTSVMRVGVALMLALILFGELVAPATEQYAQARRSIAIISYSSHANGVLEFVDGDYRFTRIVIFPTIVVEDSESEKEVHAILRDAQQHCLVTNSIDSIVEVNPTIVMR